MQNLLAKAVLKSTRDFWEKRDDPSKSCLFDFKFVVCEKATGAEEEFRVSKATVAMRCEAFARMFSSSMQEATSGEVRVDDCTIQGFSLFLGCLHGVSPVLDASNVASLLQVADKYCHSGITEHCRDWIRTVVQTHDVATIVPLLESLKRRSISDENVDKLVSSGSLLCDAKNVHLFSADFLKTMLESLSFESKTEGEVFTSCVQWAKKQTIPVPSVLSLDDDVKCEDSAMAVSTVESTDWTAHLKPLLHLIRFPLMSPKFLFANRKLIVKLVGADDFNDILFQKDGYVVYDNKFTAFPRKKVFDIYDASCVQRTPREPMAVPFEIKGKKNHTAISSAVLFADYPTSARVKFVFKMVIAAGSWFHLGVTSNAAPFAAGKVMYDLHRSRWRYKDCWYIRSTNMQPQFDGSSLFRRSRRIRIRPNGAWHTGAPNERRVRVSLEYNRTDKSLRFCADLKLGETEKHLCDFVVSEWENDKAFFPFICLEDDCQCQVDILSK